MLALFLALSMFAVGCVGAESTSEQDDTTGSLGTDGACSCNAGHHVVWRDGQCYCEADAQCSSGTPGVPGSLGTAVTLAALMGLLRFRQLPRVRRAV